MVQTSGLLKHLLLNSRTTSTCIYTCQDEYFTFRGAHLHMLCYITGPYYLNNNCTSGSEST